MNKLVTFKIKNNTALITLNRPEKRNALNPELLSLLYEAIERITNDDRIRVGIITGNGSTFCSGIDLNAIGTDTL